MTGNIDPLPDAPPPPPNTGFNPGVPFSITELDLIRQQNIEAQRKINDNAYYSEYGIDTHYDYLIGAPGKHPFIPAVNNLYTIDAKLGNLNSENITSVGAGSEGNDNHYGKIVTNTDES